jgi:hypothetical protein
MTSPCASADASSGDWSAGPAAVMIEPAPTKIRAKVPTNSATARRATSPSLARES